MEFLGKDVLVTNPVTGDTWNGRAVAYVDRPAYVVEMPDGFRISFDVSWLAEDVSGRGLAPDHVGAMRAQLLDSTGMSLTVLRERAEAGVLDDEQHAIWRRLEQLELLEGRVSHL